MTGVPPFGRSKHDDVFVAPRRGRWRGREKYPLGPAPDQEDEVRARLYSKPAPTERTVELLGRVERIADRPAA